MRILEVTHQYPPSTGGVERHVSRISQELSDRGHQVEVLAFDRAIGQSSYEDKGSIGVTRRWSVSPGGNFHLNPRVAIDVALSQADVIHVHNYHSFPSTAASLASLGKKVVFTPHYHGASASTLRSQLLKIYSLVGSSALKYSDEVITVSEWSSDVLEQDFGVSGTITIPHGLDYGVYQPEFDGFYEKPFILCVGRLEEYKNIDAAIKALAVVEDMDLVIIGSGPDRERLEKIAEDAGVAMRCHFLGSVSREELLKQYSEAEVVLNLSEFEAFGMTVGEALASGTPAVVHPKRGLSCWTDIKGVITTEGLDAYSVSNAINQAKGAKTNETPLPTWHDVAKQTEEVLQNASNQ